MTIRSRLYLTGCLLAALSAGPATTAGAGATAPALMPAQTAGTADQAAPATAQTTPSAAPASGTSPGPAAASASQAGQESAEMTTFFIALLFKGPGPSSGPPPDMIRLQQADLAYIRKIFAGGKLVVAGPFADGGDMSGMFILRAASLEEARDLCRNDPAVQAGVLLYDLHPWRAPKGLNIGIADPSIASK